MNQRKRETEIRRLERVVTVREASERIGKSESLIAKEVAKGSRGMLVARKSGATWLISLASLEEFAASARPVGNPNFGKQP